MFDDDSSPDCRDHSDQGNNGSDDDILAHLFLLQISETYLGAWLGRTWRSLCWESLGRQRRTRGKQRWKEKDPMAAMATRISAPTPKLAGSTSCELVGTA